MSTAARVHQPVSPRGGAVRPSPAPVLALVSASIPVSIPVSTWASTWAATGQPIQPSAAHLQPTTASPTDASPALLELRDIHLPAAPAPWPPAPGWWLLGLVLVALLVRLGQRGWQRWRRWQRRRQVLAELARISSLQPPERLVVAVAALLKRVALRRYGATQVAALTGADWLAFLDRTGGSGLFQDGPGQVLAEGPYAPVAAGLDRPALVATARRWLGQNL